MIIGTAGHVDHGKSALVAALTGARMDRLLEEQRRGITITLNYAPLTLPDGQVAGVVDVPGHEDLVRTMVAGASGIDVALLVVALDEGWMPQTEEHLLVLEQLGVRRGVAALTKADLVENDWLELVRSEITGRLARSRVAFGDPVVTSIMDGRGLAEVSRRLLEAIEHSEPRDPDDLFRLPVDRSFSVAGTGTVITGSSWSGSIAIGDQVEALPDGPVARVRTIEEFGHRRDRSTPGARVAVGLAGVSAETVARGAMLVRSGDGWAPSRLLDVRVTLGAGTAPLRRRTRVDVMHGTRHVGGWISPQGVIGPDEPGLARLSLDHPVTARGLDRFILRQPSPARTIGGGEVLDPMPGRRDQKLPAAWPDDRARLESLASRRPDGVPGAAIPILTGSSPQVSAALLEAARTLRTVDGHVVARTRIRSVADTLRRVTRKWHGDHPELPGIPFETLRQAHRSASWVVEAALGDLLAAGTLIRHGATVRTANFQPQIVDQQLLERLVAILHAGGLTPPEGEALARAVAGADLDRLIRHAVKTGRVVEVAPGRYCSRDTLESFGRRLGELQTGSGLSVGAVKDATGLSRKYVVPLLEWSDRAGITIREGDLRHVRQPRTAAAGGTGSA